jgi:copper(I)-binding protein
LKKIWIPLACLLALALSACGSGPGARASEELAVEDAWARPAAAGGTSAVYFVVNNPTGQEEVLLRASSAAAESTELHMSMEGHEGTMSMRPQDSVPVPAGGRLEFQPGGLHVMLVNLAEALEPEDTIPLTLHFQNAGEIQLVVPVREP